MEDNISIKAKKNKKPQQKRQEKSVTISASLGTGCYRHIKISTSATLATLHETILDAFEFIEGHAHAFFMNNRAWDDEEAYWSDMIEDEERFTSDYTLSDLKLKPNKKFVYVYDFGDDWRFALRVLNVLDEITEHPYITREKGEPPSQFGNECEFDDEANEDDEERDEDE